MTKLMPLSVSIFLIATVTLCGQTTKEALTKELQQHFENSNLPGFCVAVVSEKGVLYTEGFGYRDKKSKTLFTSRTIENLGSTSKAILGMTLVKAIEDKKLAYNSEINDFLPFNIINPYYEEEPILVKHLATHSSSILDTKHYGKSYIAEGGDTNTKEIHQEHLKYLKSHKEFDLKDFLFNILNKEGDWYKKKNFIKDKPGRAFEYANLNAAVAALVIENATQMSLERFSQECVFNPLGMNSTTWVLEVAAKEEFAIRYFPNGKIVPNYSLITYPDGGLYSNVEDLSLFLIELIRAYNGNSTFLKSQSAKTLLPGDGDNQRAFLGMGAKSKNIGHAGSDPGVQTDVQFNADSKIGRVILCNVNAQDNDELYRQYREIHNIIARYEKQISQIKE